MIAIDRYLDRIESLPPAPTVAIQLLELLSDPDRDIDHIVELIKYDPSLTAATLKRCNSGALSGAEPATDMFEAVSRLRTALDLHHGGRLDRFAYHDPSPGEVSRAGIRLNYGDTP